MPSSSTTAQDDQAIAKTEDSMNEKTELQKHEGAEVNRKRPRAEKKKGKRHSELPSEAFKQGEARDFSQNQDLKAS